MRDSPFPVLLRAALDAKSRADGAYSCRQLGRDTGLDFSYCAKLLRGDQHEPSRDTVTRIARALAGYLDKEEALIAAGYLPDGADWRELALRHLEQRLVSAGA